MSKTVTIYHSPDADDAFMFYGLVSGAISLPGYDFLSELKDIESLNQMTRRGELDATAVSVHAFSHLGGQYSILVHGASMGEMDYGPMLVVKQSSSLSSKKMRIGLPGELTSATLAMKLYLKEQEMNCETIQLHFEEIEEAVLRSEIDAGLLIHEGQLTHQEKGLKSVVDLGQWWWEKTDLPLPLGVNVVRSSLAEDAKKAFASVLLGSIRYSMAHRAKALDYALSFGRGLERQKADDFVGMYVNERTLNLGEDGKNSIKLFLKCGAEAGFCPEVREFDFVQADREL